MRIGAIADRLLGMIVPKLTAAPTTRSDTAGGTPSCATAQVGSRTAVCDACRTVVGVVHACTSCQVTGTC